jgi:hypothetical protein
MPINNFLFIEKSKIDYNRLMGVLRFRLGNEKLIACGGCRLASLIIR